MYFTNRRYSTLVCKKSRNIAVNYNLSSISHQVIRSSNLLFSNITYQKYQSNLGPVLNRQPKGTRNHQIQSQFIILSVSHNTISPIIFKDLMDILYSSNNKEDIQKKTSKLYNNYILVGKPVGVDIPKG